MFTFCSIHYKGRRNTKYVKSCLQGIFLPSSTFRGDSSCVHTAPTCNHMHQHAHYKSQTLAAIPLSGHMKIQHTLIEMGSAALVAAVLYLGKVT